MRTQPASLFKLRGHIKAEPTTLMIDSGASSEFIDTDFARRCGLTLRPSNRTIRLADGTIVQASGEAVVAFTLESASKNGSPIPFSTTFTVTPLEGYDAILGLTWLAEHDPVIGWKERSITIRTPGRAPQLVRPVEHTDCDRTILSDEANAVLCVYASCVVVSQRVVRTESDKRCWEEERGVSPVSDAVNIYRRQERPRPSATVRDRPRRQNPPTCISSRNHQNRSSHIPLECPTNGQSNGSTILTLSA